MSVQCSQTKRQLLQASRLPHQLKNRGNEATKSKALEQQEDEEEELICLLAM